MSDERSKTAQPDPPEKKPASATGSGSSTEDQAFTYDDTAAELLPPADEEPASTDDATTTDNKSTISSKKYHPNRLARISQARKLRKTRLSLGNFILQANDLSSPQRTDIRSGNSSESVSSYGSVPSDFEDLCNNN